MPQYTVRALINGKVVLTHIYETSTPEDAGQQMAEYLDSEGFGQAQKVSLMGAEE